MGPSVCGTVGTFKVVHQVCSTAENCKKNQEKLVWWKVKSWNKRTPHDKVTPTSQDKAEKQNPWKSFPTPKRTIELRLWLEPKNLEGEHWAKCPRRQTNLLFFMFIVEYKMCPFDPIVKLFKPPWLLTFLSSLLDKPAALSFRPLHLYQRTTKLGLQNAEVLIPGDWRSHGTPSAEV